MGLVTVRTFDTSIEAHIFKTKLESEGIEVFLIDEEMISVNPLYNIAVGGIKLQVDEAELKRALQAVQELENSPSITDDGALVVCPNCGSSSYIQRFVSMKGLNEFLNILFAFLFLIYPLHLKYVKKRKSCGTEFS